ncbi:MAG: tetratricopeptide repeat-containing sensor histidine kinase [Cyclobacteriaceae bacterium]|nr:tetratricopeptide repeat-containing sensor histidine kinase [Cyclobacteriaceae bacterium]MDW8331396.1 tetratricopeptide repeat-containing sensor histidine kinase [Cyclobacteriaceae bacterium]
MLEKDPVKEVNILNDIAYELFDIDDSTAAVFASRAIQLALKAGYKKGLKRALTYVGVGLVSKGDFVGGLRYYHFSDTVKAPDAEDVTIYNHTMMSNAFRDLAMFDSAMYYQQMAMREAKAYGKPKYLATVHKNMALLEIYQFKLTEALENLRLAQQYLDRDYENYLQAEIWTNTGKTYLKLGQSEKAREYFLKQCSLVNKMPDRFLKIKCKINLSELAQAESQYSTALEEAFAAFDLLQEYSYPPQQVEIYQQIGEIYSETGQYELAAKFLFEALKIAQKKKLQQSQGVILSELAWVYKEMSNYPLALDYINRSLSLRESIGDLHGISNAHNVRGLIYMLQKKYDEAIKELEKSRAIREQIGHLEGIAASIFNLSLVYDELGQLDKAISLKRQAIAIEEQLPNKLNLGISINGLAKTLIAQKRFDEALPYLKRAEEIAREMNARIMLRNVYVNYADYYEGIGNYRKATEYLRKHQQLSDSIYSASSRAKLAEMQALYQVEQKEQQIKLLQQERELRESQVNLQRAQINNLRIVLAAGLLVLILVSALAWSIYKAHKDLQRANREIKEQNEEIQAQTEELTEANRALSRLNRELAEKQEEIQSQAEELLEANQTINEINRNLESEIEKRTQELKQAYNELDTFFYRSSHDFRRPLTTFMGLAEVAKITVKDPNALELFAKVRETALSLDKMLVKLQSISDVGAQELFYREVLVKELFDSICDTYRDEIERKNIQISCEVKLIRPFYSYPALVKVILENLLENSIQFSAPVNPKISLTVDEANDAVVFELKDNGHGIPFEFQDKVFDMYFRGSHYSKGNGLGLYIVKKAVEKLNGEIMFTSEVDKGTTFIIRLPRNSRVTTVAA